jgi:hypothetical protein
MPPFAPGYRRAHHRRRDANSIAIRLKVSCGTVDGPCRNRSTLRDEANRRNPYLSGSKCPFEWRPQRQMPIACVQEAAGSQSNPLQRRVRKMVRQHDRQAPARNGSPVWRGEARDAAAAGGPRNQILTRSRLRLQRLAGTADRESRSYEMALEFSGLKSAACGSPPRRAYRPDRRCGRVAEGGGLLNRYRVVKPYRGFESLRLRQCMAPTI